MLGFLPQEQERSGPSDGIHVSWMICRGFIPVEMRCCKRELVSAVDATEVINALLNMTMSDFDANGMEEETAGAEMEPYIDEIQM